MPRIAKKVTLTEKQKDVLKQIITSRAHGADHIVRAQMVFLSTTSKSNDDLKDKILSFVTYFNDTMAKAFKWTYRGSVLKA